MRKNTISRLGLALLCVLALGLLMAGTAGAETTGTTPDGFTYSIEGDAATITGYTGTGTAISIPENVEGVAVKAIGGSAFIRKSSLTGVYIPSSVTIIGESAFYECSSLTSVNLPSGVTSIGSGAFRGCSSLTSVNIPSGVTSIEFAAFASCSSLTSVNIPSSVTRIGNSAFNGCRSLTAVNIPSGVTSIGSNAFYGCRSLTSVTIPSGITSIEYAAFGGCSSLTSINIPSGVTSIGEAAFGGCSSLTSVNIPSGVTSIESFAFSGCSSLTSVNIPSGVTSIGDHAFSGCSSLTLLTIPFSVNSIGPNAFSYSYLTLHTYPGSVAETYAKANSIPYELLPVNYVISITLDEPSLLMSPGDITSISAEFLPVDATIKAVNWTSSDTAVAMVTTDGQVMAVGLGSATITATAKDGGGASASCMVYVTEPDMGIKLEPALLEMKTGDEKPMTATPVTVGDALPALTWHSDNQAVATVDTAGKVKAIGPGTATISASSADKAMKASCVVTVTQPVTGIAVEPSSAGLDVGGTQQLSVTVSPDNASDESIQWSSGNTAVATVDNKGLVSAIAPGTTTITATAQDGSGVSGSAEVTVNMMKYDMSGVAWNYSGALTYDGSPKTVLLTGLPESITPEYIGNTATNAGSYTASVILTSEDANYESPAMPDQPWTIIKAQYDMSGVAWNYSEAFTHDGTVKTVALSGLPESITPEYSGNAATEAGTYIASVTFTYDTVNYEAPIMPDLTWVIEPAVVPVLKGDATNDGTIDILDLVSIIDYIVSGTVPKSLENANANGSGDGTVDILDLVWVIDRIVGG